jgi:hypothetical protein
MKNLFLKYFILLYTEPPHATSGCIMQHVGFVSWLPLHLEMMKNTTLQKTHYTVYSLSVLVARVKSFYHRISFCQCCWYYMFVKKKVPVYRFHMNMRLFDGVSRLLETSG